MAPPRICLHMITFGDSRGQPDIPMPVLMSLDLSGAQAPPRHLLQRYTGASFELARSFFSLPGHESLYRNCLRTLDDRLDSGLADPRERVGGCVAVVVNCRAGMHRSVAMVERLARDVEEGWPPDLVEVVVEHLDTDVIRAVRRAQRVRAGMH